MLEGDVRGSLSRSGVKALRRDGYLISNIYGKGHDSIRCSFKKNDFIRFVRSKSSLIFPVKLRDKVYNVVVKEYQKDPVSGDILHLDLMLAMDGVVSKYMVPVKVKGTPLGVKNRGVLVFSRRRVLVKCSPENLPNEYLLDVGPLDLGDTVLVRDLPTFDGVKIVDGPSVAVVGVMKAK